jgi:hypothetical protein
VRALWYDDEVGRKKGDARRRVKIFGECRNFG